MTDLTALNREHFDSVAATYGSQPCCKKWNEDLSDVVSSHLDWFGADWLNPEIEAEASHTLKLLDYACGYGSLSRPFAAYCTSIVGVDVSTGMVEEYNKNANNQGLEPSEMRAVEGDLLSTPTSISLDAPEFYNFDFAMCGLAFHHFEDINLAAKRLVERVKKGSGRVLIIDFLPHESLDSGDSKGHESRHHGPKGGHDFAQHTHAHAHHSHHSHNADNSASAAESTNSTEQQLARAIKTVHHMGISVDNMKAAFELAGCCDIKTETLGSGITFACGERKIAREIYMLVATRA